MKKFTVMLMIGIMASCLITGCGKKKEAPQEEAPAAAEETKEEEPKEEAPAPFESAGEVTEVPEGAEVLEPLPSGIDVTKANFDCSLPASFEVSSYQLGKSDEYELSVEFYTQDLYDAVDITTVKEGTYILVQGKPVLVEKAEDKDGSILINGGLGGSATGYTFVANEGGTYVVRLENDATTYSSIGKNDLVVSKDAKLTDEAFLPEEKEARVIESEKIGEYFEELAKDNMDNFNQLNTVVTVENGVITDITRHYIP